MDSETRRELSSDQLATRMSSLSLDKSRPDASQPQIALQPPSTAGNSVKAKRKGGRSAETTWNHSRPPFPHKISNHKYCIHCQESDIYHTNVSSNMRGHLKTHHNIIVEPTQSSIQQDVVKQLEQLYLQAESSNQTEQVDAKVLRKVLNRDRIQEAFVSLLVAANLPFRLVELPQFHAYNQTLNPEAAGFVTTSHAHVSTKVGQVWANRKDIVQRQVQSALSRVHLSVDIWTSPNNLLFLAICSHFVNSQNDLKKALLGLREVEGHSGEDQFTTLLPVLQEYGITRNIGAIVADNSSTNDTLCRAVSRYLREEEKIEWNPVFQRARCIGHIINLAVQAFLFQGVVAMEQLASYDEEDAREKAEDESGRQRTVRGMGSLGKLHNVVTHIRGSAGRTKQFKNLAGRMIPLDNRTRWNSWYSMIRVALDHEGAVDSYTKANYESLEAEFLEPDDWKNLRRICAFLQPFNESTLKTQGDQATIDRVLLTMDILNLNQ
jgi:hypothetical protein